jgi:pimeloyl-ACP methyl ester carboxylesterase
MSALRERCQDARLWLLGHSEGGLIATLAAQEDSNVSGLVLIAAPGRRLGDNLRYSAIAALGQGHRVDVTLPALQPLFRSAVQGYLISALAYDPAALLARFTGPVLLLQGQADLQVGLADLARLTQAQPGATIVGLPGINHVLKQAPTDREGNLATYSDPTLPLAPGIGDAIAGFIHARRSAAASPVSQSV